MLQNVLWTVALTLAAVGALSAGLLLSGAEVKTLVRENGPVENVQAGGLVIGCLIFGFIAVRAGAAAYSLLFAALTLFYLTFALREIEVDAFLTDYPVLAILESPLRNYWVGALWVVLILVVLRRLGDVLRAFIRWVRHLPGYLIIAGGAFYGLAEGVEKGAFPFVPAWVKAYEELPELVAVVLMLLCAGLSVRWIGQGHARGVAGSYHPAQQPDAGERRDGEADERHLDRRVQ